MAAAANAATALPYKLQVQVYEGPHDATGKSWKSKTVELVPGSKAAEEWVEAHRQSNPNLVKAYEELTATSSFTGFVKEMLQLDGGRPTITLVDDTRKYVDADKDGKPDTGDKAEEEEGVWPHARGDKIYISQSYLDTYNSTSNLQHLLIHELSHTQDDTNRDAGDYGPDDSHRGDEQLYNHGHTLPFFWRGGHFSDKAAFMEGFAEFMPLLFDPSQRSGYVSDVSDICRETEKGKYTYTKWTEASFDELESVEHINSLIMFDLTRFVPGGKDKLLAAFRATQSGGRTLKDLLAEMIRANPADAFTIAAIFDAYTRFQAPDSVLDKLLGNPLASAYRKDWREKAKAQNGSNTVGDAENVGRWAAANSRLASGEAALADLDRRIAELEGWNLSPWDLLGGPASFFGRNLWRQHERAKLLERRAALQKELERLRPAQAARTGALIGARLRSILMLPPPAGVPALEGLTTGPARVPATRPAKSFGGLPVPWGR
jgi:hypothetical protein